MSNVYITEAFKEFNILDEAAEDFALNPASLEEFSSFLDSAGADDDTDVEIYDMQAEAEEDLKDSYMGKIILDCKICHSNIFEDRDNLEIDEQGNVNFGMECPYCMSDDGYNIIGQISPFKAEVEFEEPEVEEPVETEIEIDTDNDGEKDIEIEVEPEVEEEAKEEIEEALDESLNEACESEDSDELKESIEDVSVTTEDETMTMTTKEDGGVVIETSPKEEEEAEVISDEMIAPIPEEEQDEIIDTATEEPEAEEDMFSDEEFEDELPFDEFDEESFDGLGESYLRRCYENVNAFKTSNVSVEGNKLIVEGKITFDSGNEKNTKFVFESVKNKNGKVRFTGLNEQISKGKKSFKLNCSLDNTKLVCESLNYNYKSKNELDESVRVYGTVRK